MAPHVQRNHIDGSYMVRPRGARDDLLRKSNGLPTLFDGKRDAEQAGESVAALLDQRDALQDQLQALRESRAAD